VKESDETEELRGTGYWAAPVRRRAPDYRNVQHLAVLAKGSSPHALQRFAMTLVEVWHRVTKGPGQSPARGLPGQVSTAKRRGNHD
jgi:hypothetical protein